MCFDKKGSPIECPQDIQKRACFDNKRVLITAIYHPPGNDTEPDF